MSASDSDEEILCPICAEPLDATERNFKPCRCGYQMCQFCFHHIKEDLGGLCPQCRTPYSEEKYTFTPPTDKEKKEKKSKVKKTKPTKCTISAQELEARKKLVDIRVVQKNLVYVTNIPLEMVGSEDSSSPNETTENAIQLLRRNEFFGQYGHIIKLVVNTATVHVVHDQGPTVSCYVTYKQNDEAASCIRAVNGAWLEGKLLRASNGTTKYCAHFLRGATCNNPDCLYLHELGHDKDSFTKEAMAVGKNLFSSHVQPRIAFNLDSYQNVLPPPASAPAKPSSYIPPPIAYERALQLLPPDEPLSHPHAKNPNAILEHRQDDGSFVVISTGIYTLYLSHIPNQHYYYSSSSNSSTPSSKGSVIVMQQKNSDSGRERLTRSEDTNSARARSASPSATNNPLKSSQQSAQPQSQHQISTNSNSNSNSKQQQQIEVAPPSSPPPPAPMQPGSPTMNANFVSPGSSPPTNVPPVRPPPSAPILQEPISTTINIQSNQNQSNHQSLSTTTTTTTTTANHIESSVNSAFLPLPPVLMLAETFRMWQTRAPIQQQQQQQVEKPITPTTAGSQSHQTDFVGMLLDETNHSQPQNQSTQKIPKQQQQQQNPSTNEQDHLNANGGNGESVENRRQKLREMFPNVNISFSQQQQQQQQQQQLLLLNEPHKYNPMQKVAANIPVTQQMQASQTQNQQQHSRSKPKLKIQTKAQQLQQQQIQQQQGLNRPLLLSDLPPSPISPLSPLPPQQTTSPLEQKQNSPHQLSQEQHQEQETEQQQPQQQINQEPPRSPQSKQKSQSPPTTPPTKQTKKIQHLQRPNQTTNQQKEKEQNQSEVIAITEEQQVQVQPPQPSQSPNSRKQQKQQKKKEKQQQQQQQQQQGSAPPLPTENEIQHPHVCPGCGGLYPGDSTFTTTQSQQTASETRAANILEIAKILGFETQNPMSNSFPTSQTQSHVSIVIPTYSAPLCPLWFTAHVDDLMNDQHSLTELLSIIQQQQQDEQEEGEQNGGDNNLNTDTEVQRLEKEFASANLEVEEIESRLKQVQLRNSRFGVNP